MHIKSLLLLTVAVLLAAPSLAQDSITYKATEVSPGLYMLEGEGGFAGGNIGVSVGPDGVVLIDDGLPPLTDKLIAAVRKLSKDEIEFVINTHVHGDHVGGNETLGKQGATIVAHDNLRRRMIDEGKGGDQPTPAPREALPVLTFADSVTVHLNGLEAFVFHVAHAHTDGDAVIHFRNINVIHTGDTMFNGIYPFIDLDSGGSVSGYIAAQRRILGLANAETKIIPGHGPLASKADLEANVAMIETGYAKVMELVKAGKSEDEVLAANPLKEFDADWSWDFINTERMTKTFYRSATAN